MLIKQVRNQNEEKYVLARNYSGVQLEFTTTPLENYKSILRLLILLLFFRNLNFRE